MSKSTNKDIKMSCPKIGLHNSKPILGQDIYYTIAEPTYA
jgi:hypothetical protein